MRVSLASISKVSTYLVTPRIDEKTPDWKKEALADLPQHVNWLQVADCGHSLYTEKPKEIAELIRQQIR